MRETQAQPGGKSVFNFGPASLGAWAECATGGGWGHVCSLAAWGAVVQPKAVTLEPPLLRGDPRGKDGGTHFPVGDPRHGAVVVARTRRAHPDLPKQGLAIGIPPLS